MEVSPYSYFWWLDISEVPGCHLLQQTNSQWGPQKLLEGLVSHELTTYLSVWDISLTQWIMAILSKGWKPHNFESCNSLKLSFRNIQDLCLNFVECQSFLESNPPDILALCQTTLDDSNDSICDAAIVHRNLLFFFHLFQQNKSSESKKFQTG